MRLQIIPDILIDNKNTDILINNVHTYRSPLQRMKADKDKIILNDQYIIAYEIELSKSAEFYLYFDDSIRSQVNTEIGLTWHKATVKEAKTALRFTNPIISILDMQYHHFLSLKIDKRGLFPLPGILETMKLIKDIDKVFIQVIFEPESHDWYKTVEVSIKDFQRGYVARKIELNKKNITAGLIKAGIKTLQETLSIISFFLTDDEMQFDDIDTAEYEDLLRRGLSPNTQGKSEWNGFNAQIRVVVDSADEIRRESIMRGIVTAFKGLNEDNRIIEKRVKLEKYLPLINERKIPWTLNKNILSAAELGQIIQLPTKAYQEIYNIHSIDTREVDVPPELLKGDIKIGTMTNKGQKSPVYWINNKNVLALPKIVIGPMGSGKSEYTKRFCVEAARKGDGVIHFDYIKDCEISNSIKGILKNCITINLADPAHLHAMAFPEMQPSDNTWNRLKVANTLSRQTEYLINSVVIDDENGPLTAPMLRYLNAACMVVYIHPDKTLNDVFQVLRNWRTRLEYINMAEGIIDKHDEIIVDLETLHDRDRAGRINGTRDDLIIGIINRISCMLRDIYVKRMLSAGINYEQNFSRWMDEGKTILIQIPESTFSNKSIKDMLVTYYMSRIWLAALQRKNYNRVCHVVTDEIYQVPTAAALVSGVITEARKFGIDFYFTIHYLKQFRALHDAIRSAGCSYMLLAGTEKENLKALSEELEPFTMADGLSMKPFHSLNLINYGNQYAKFISQLPKPI
jgi:hypothetical protein